MSDDAHSAAERDAATAGKQLYAPADGVHAERLAAACHAFNEGDFRGARAHARATIARAATPDEHNFASTLLAMTATDPLALGVGVTALVALALIAMMTL